MRITSNDLEDLACGSTFLGCGGGGDPYLGCLALRQQLGDEGAVEIISLDSLGDDALVVPIAFIGAPTAFIEKLITLDAARLALTRMEELLGRKADAVMVAELGGVQTTIPMVVAAGANLPVVDADGIGRAFPQVQMTTFGINGIPVSPLVAVDAHGECVIIEAKDNLRAEHYARAVCTSMGFQATASLYSMRGADAKRVSVPGTVSQCLKVGRAIRGRNDEDGGPFERLIRSFDGSLYGGARVLFDGRIDDLSRQTRRGWAVGQLELVAFGDESLRMTIEFQNELLLARTGTRIRAIVPDLICVLDRETADPIPVERLKYGQRVKVVAAGCVSQLRTPTALEVVGPAAFGLEHPFTPLEALL